MTIEFDSVISDRICPYCKAKNDGFTAVDEKLQVPPAKGDISLCISCAELAVYKKDLHLRKSVEGDINQVDLLEVQKAQRIIREFHRIREGQSDPEAVQTPEDNN